MEIAAKIRDAVSAVARRHGIALVLLFGSFAAGNTRENSDVDIAVRFQDREVSLRRLLEVQAELSGIFPGREIDAVSLERADPFFMKKIAERILVLYEEPGAADAFLRLAFKRYQDHGKYLAMESDFATRSRAVICVMKKGAARSREPASISRPGKMPDSSPCTSSSRRRLTSRS